LVQHDGDIFTGRGDGGTLGLRTELLNDDRVISILNRSFVPVAVSNEDLRPGGRATEAAQREQIRIYHEAVASKFSAGDRCVYLGAPDGKVLTAMIGPSAHKPPNLLPLLERFRGPEGAPIVKPAPQSRAPSHRPDDLVLHLVARYVEPDGG